jgi:4-oxalomesaconate hydratase
MPTAVIDAYHWAFIWGAAGSGTVAEDPAHDGEDPYNMNHPMAYDGTLKARVYAEASGFPAEGKASRDDPPPVFIFEPHQPEQLNFRAPVVLEIISMRERKRNAMESMAAQEHLVKYSTVIGERRAVEASSDSSGRHIQYAEPFQRIYPRVTD